MTMDRNQSHYAGGMHFNNHIPYSSPHPQGPQFTDPWVTTSSAAPGMYATSGINHNLGQQNARLNNNVSTGSYSLPSTVASAGNLYSDFPGTQQELLTSPQDMMSPSRPLPTGYGSDVAYNNAPSPAHTIYTSAGASPFDTNGYVTAPPAPVRASYSIPHQDHSRRLSQPSVSSNSFFDGHTDVMRSHRQNSLIDFNNRGLSNNDTVGFSRDPTLDGARDMLAMSQNATPRNIYAPRIGRESGDSYNFPATHSTSSSISSQSTFPYYSSVDSSVSEYSNGSDIEPVSTRTLPPPSGILGGGMPPAPQSMMSQFSSKVSSSTMKKHKCKVCDKRFTRPSSLQTHMYSHTGEKRKSPTRWSIVSILIKMIAFPCNVEGCGRHFSVVSNLRRHKKVHKGEERSEAGSEDHNSDE